MGKLSQIDGVLMVAFHMLQVHTALESYRYHVHYSLFSAVMMSIPVMASVSEGDGSVEICVMLAAIVNTGRAVTVNLTTYTGTGKFFRIMMCA